MNRFIEIPASKHSLACRRLVFGVGLNDATYNVVYELGGKQLCCPYYRVWSDMIKRCYSKKALQKLPTYIGCSVIDSWLIFSNFKEWMLKQDWVGKQIDKDILYKDNKVYSPETCIFVTSQINTLILCGAGVSWHKATNKFRTRCSVNGKSIELGLFHSEEEAAFVYRKYKNTLITEVAYQQTNVRLKDALLRIAATYA